MRVCVFTLMLGYDYLFGNYKRTRNKFTVYLRDNRACVHNFFKTLRHAKI